MNVEDKIKKLEEKQKIMGFEIEKRLVALEQGFENIDLAFSRGALSEEQEKRVSKIEEKLETIEDQLMILNIDIIKLKEEIQSSVPCEGKGGVKDIIIQNRRLNEIENMIKNLEANMSKGHAKIVGDADLRQEFESFKQETEENIEIIVESIKKILTKIK